MEKNAALGNIDMWLGQQSHNCTRRQGFAGSAFAHNAQDFVRFEMQFHLLHRVGTLTVGG